MTYAILSDVHANETALRRVLEDAKACGAERFFCLGDSVGYGPRPVEAVSLVRASCAVVVAGNHDDAVSGRMNPREFNELAEAGVRRHRAALSRASLKWLKALPYVAAGDGFVITHGSLVDPPTFAYVETAADAQACFDVLEKALVFVGHTHVPKVFVTDESGSVRACDPVDFTLEDGCRYIVNPGSVGFPREADGVCRSSYVLYDSTRRTVIFRFLPFAVESVMQRDVGAGKGPFHRPLVVVGLGLALAAGLGAAAFFGGEPKDSPPDAASPDARLVVTSVSWHVSRSNTRLLPALTLANGSPHVLLKTRFTDADGRELDANALEVKRSRTKPYPIPRKAARAELKVLKLRPEDTPLFSSFDPKLDP